LTDLMVKAGTTRVNVLDTPVKSLKSLADPHALAEWFPELKRYGDSVAVQTELILTKPLRVTNVAISSAVAGPTESAPKNELEFQLPEVKFAISIKPDPTQAAWIPFAQVSGAVRQPARLQLIKPNELLRSLVLTWADAEVLNVQAHFAPNYQPQDETIQVEQIKDAVTRGWQEWTRIGAASRMNLPDITFGDYTKLRAAKVAGTTALVLSTFAPAGVELTNSTPRPLVYETKGPFSDWGGPYTLKPGDTSYFPIPYPLTFRQRTQQGESLYTLPAGTHSEYRIPITGGPPRLFQAREPSGTVTTRTDQ
jgi:hypothetical protein